jgi:acyl-CoA synthetase (AMP-forming)/AMP-acid ligase II
MSAAGAIADLIALVAHGRLMLSDGRVVTIADLWRDAVANAAPQWIAPGDRVVLSDAPGADLVIAALAIWRRGGVPVFGVDPRRCGDWPADVRVRNWPDGAVLHDGASAADSALAAIHASSGSTGRPKLARRSFASLAAEAECYVERYAFLAGARAYLAAPITHSFAFGALLGLLAGGCVVQLAPVFRPRALANALRGCADIVVLTPPMARLAIEAFAAIGNEPARAALVIAGAGRVPDRLDTDFRRAFGCGLARNYGASETGASFGAAQSLPEGCLGRPFHGVNVASPVTGGGVDELIIDLGHAIAGIEGEAATAEMQQGRWRSGDLAEIDNEQRLWLRGRLDDRVKVNGRLVDCGALATQARAAPGISDAVALTLPRPQRAEIHDVVLVCECRDPVVGAPVVTMPDPRMPVIVLMQAEFPRTAAGKPDRDKLRRFAQARLYPRDEPQPGRGER